MPMRIGIIPRYGASQDVKWFECRPTFVLHWINAWEEGDEVVVDGYFEDDPSPRVASDATIEAKMFRFLDLHSMKSRPYRWRLNLKTGAVNEGYLSDTITELGGAVCRPIAERSSDNTTTMRVKLVTITTIDGAIDRRVISATSCSARSEVTRQLTRPPPSMCR